MWRCISNLSKCRSGTLRSAGPLTRDENPTNGSRPTVCDTTAHQRKCTHTEYSRDGWEGKWYEHKAKRHCASFTCTDFGNVILISSSLLLTCEISKLFKAFCRQEQRKKNYNCYERFLANRSFCFPSQILNILPEPGPNGQLRTPKLSDVPPGVHVNEDVSEDETRFSGVDDVRRFGAVSDGAETETTSHDYDTYFTQFESDWKLLCEAVESQMEGKRSDDPMTSNAQEHSASLFNLAVLKESLGDTQVAVDMYESAVLHGNSQAAHNLALLLLKKNCAGDYERALELLKSASKMGLSRSMVELGVLCVQNNQLFDAYKLFTDAAEKEDADAAYFLAVFHENGLVVERNACKAAHWYRVASQAGHKDAQCSLARFFQHGLGGLPVDSEAAQKLSLSTAINPTIAPSSSSTCDTGLSSRSQLRCSSSAPELHTNTLTCLTSISKLGVKPPSSVKRSETDVGALGRLDSDSGIDDALKDTDSSVGVTFFLDEDFSDCCDTSRTSGAVHGDSAALQSAFRDGDHSYGFSRIETHLAAATRGMYRADSSVSDASRSTSQISINADALSLFTDSNWSVAGEEQFPTSTTMCASV